MLMEISILNYFDKGLSWDIFVQGFIVCIVLSFAFLYLLYLMPVFHKANQSFIDFYLITFSDKIKLYFKDYSNGNKFISVFVKIFQMGSLTSSLIIISFMLGIVFSNVSDSFMDQENIVHLGLKKNWTDLGAERGFDKTDEEIKIDVFDKIFGKNSLNPNKIKSILGSVDKMSILNNDTDLLSSDTRKSIIMELYYHSKHKILESDKWSGYLSYTQTLVNLNQTFCFCLWILTISAFIGFLVTFIVSLAEKLQTPKTSSHTYFGLLILLIILTIFIANIFSDSNQNWNSIWMFFLFGVISIILIQFRLIRGYRLSTSLLLTLTSVFLYHLTAFSWLTCEIESCAKTYGLLIYMDKDLNETSIELFKQMLIVR